MDDPAIAAFSALHRVTAARDLLGLRDALKTHGEAAAGSEELAAAQALHDELLASTTNDRHEAWLKEQEWPTAENAFFSRRGHPLTPSTPFRRPWPKPTSRAMHGGATGPDWPPEQWTADMRHEAWLQYECWPSAGWRQVNTADHVAFTPHEFPQGRRPEPEPAPWTVLPSEVSDRAFEAASKAKAEPNAAASEAAIRVAMEACDLIGLRDTLASHAGAAKGTLSGTATVAEATSLVEVLLARTANMQHEARQFSQEWPSAANGFYSRRGHPLETALRHTPWPKTADWPPNAALRLPEPSATDPYLARHRRSFEYVTVRPLAEVILAQGPGQRAPGGARGDGFLDASVAVAADMSSRATDHRLRRTDPQARHTGHTNPRANHPCPPEARRVDPRAFALAQQAIERNESRHQVASAALTGKSVLGSEFVPPPAAEPPPTRPQALLQEARANDVGRAAELARSAAHEDLLRRASIGEGGRLGRGTGFRPGSAAARRAAGGRPSVWPGEIATPMPC